MAKISTISDNFDDGSIAAIWTPNAWGGTVSETGGVIRITPTNNSADKGAEIATATTYDLTASAVSVKAVTMANGTVDTSFGVYVDANNYIDLFVESGTLYARKTVAGTSTNIATVAFSASTRYWRLRESGGTTYWEYSADGLSWTTLTSQANPITLTAVQLILSVYEWEAVNPAGYADFDDLNILPSSGNRNFMLFF